MRQAPVVQTPVSASSDTPLRSSGLTRVSRRTRLGIQLGISPETNQRTNWRTTTARVAVCGALAVLSTALVSCGGDDDASSPTTTVSSSDAVTGSLPRFESTTAIRDALAGSPWECQRWSDIDDGVASCIVDNGDGNNQPSIHGVYLKDRPGETAAVIFQSEPETPAIVIGGNWLFDCGPGTAFGVDRCEKIATTLGGLVVLPESQ